MGLPPTPWISHLDGPAPHTLDLSPCAADHAHCQRLVEAEGVPNRKNLLANLVGMVGGIKKRRFRAFWKCGLYMV